MQKNHKAPRAFAISTAVAAALAATAVHAESINLNNELVKRLQSAGKLNSIYKAKTGKDLPSTLTAVAIFEGQVGGRGMRISAPGVIPTSPLVMQQDEVINCNSESMSQQLQIDSSSTNATSFQNTDQFETSKEISATLSYDSPWGVSGSTTATAKQSQVTIKSTGGGESTTTAWKYAPTITVPAGKAITTQFVVTQQKLTDILYTANFVLDGPMRLVFSAGAAGYSWVERRGASLPTQPFAPLSFGKQYNGAPLYACRVKVGDAYFVGKSHGDSVCYFGGAGTGPMGMMPGLRTDAYEYLVGPQAALTLSDPNAANTYDADTKGLQLCIGDYALPGFVKAGVCYVHNDNWTRATRNYKVLLDPTVGGVEVRLPDIGKELTEAQRTFDLRGKFSGVYAVKGNLRVGSAMPATDCQIIAANTVNEPAPSRVSAASASSISGLKPAGGSAKPRAVKVKRVAPTAALPETAAAVAIPAVVKQ